MALYLYLHHKSATFYSCDWSSVYSGTINWRESSDKESQKETTKANDFIKSRNSQGKEALLAFVVVGFQSKFSWAWDRFSFTDP